MIPYKTINTISLPFIHHHKVMKRKQQFPFKENMINNHEGNQLDVKRALLHLVTIPHFRASFVFEQHDDGIECTSFEPIQKPLSTLEARGIFTLTMKELKYGPECLRKISGNPNDCIKSPKRVIHFLQELDDTRPVFIILVFRHFLFATGTFYNETTMCQALIEFCPSERQPVISMMRTAEDGIPFYLKRVAPSFSIDVPRLHDWEGWEEIVL